MNAMGVSPAGRLDYATAKRLDGIGWCAIGDMVTSLILVKTAEVQLKRAVFH
jgi:hypothetical protein